MGLVADAGRAWKKAMDEAEAASNPKQRAVADGKVREAADAYHRAVRQQPADTDDADDAVHRKGYAKAGTSHADDPLLKVVDSEAEVAGSIKIPPTSGTGKGSR